MTIPTQVRIDAETKRDAVLIFSKLGLDMSSAINMFLHQCVIRGGIPFEIYIPNYNKETKEAIEETRKLSKKKNKVTCNSIDELELELHK